MTRELTETELLTAMRDGRVEYEHAIYDDGDNPQARLVFAYVDGERYPDLDTVAFPGATDLMLCREVAAELTEHMRHDDPRRTMAKANNGEVN